MPEHILAGVDGGASKTRALIVSAEGGILGAATVQSSSAYHREPEEAAAVVTAAVREALAQAGRNAPVLALGAGLAGADDPSIRARLIAALEGSGLAQVVFVDHDAAAALAGGTALAPGVVLVAGTGSVAFGVDASGRRARADGWGPLLGDDGSGYAIGRSVLRAAMRAFDGRGPATALRLAVQERFALASLASLKIAVRNLAIDQIAAVAPIAFAAALGGDAVAAEILQGAGERLAVAVQAVARALEWQRTRFPLVTIGGLFDARPGIHAPLLEALARLECPAVWQPPRLSAEAGAAILAARAAGLDVERLLARIPPAEIRDRADQGGGREVRR
jgi:N-acetylglucosamine kinase-like BadF-type ATPase